MKTIYLAGPITGISYGESVDWRDKAIVELKKFNIIGLSPMRGKFYLKDEVSIGDSYEQSVLSCQKGIYTRDRSDCMTCDALLVNLVGAKTVSIGTVMEIAWADARQIPIIVAMEKESNLHDHAMIRESIGFRVETVNQAIKVAEAIFASE